MCLSRNMSRNSAAPTHSQKILNAMSHVQAHQRQHIQGYQSARYSDSDSEDHSTINNATETYTNDAKCYGRVPSPIDSNVTWKIIGSNLNGIKLYDDMFTLITVAERLRALQA
jgi:hypothetical protein